MTGEKKTFPCAGRWLVSTDWNLGKLWFVCEVDGPTTFKHHMEWEDVDGDTMELDPQEGDDIFVVRALTEYFIHFVLRAPEAPQPGLN
jgi:hypothetical protein